MNLPALVFTILFSTWSLLSGAQGNSSLSVLVEKNRILLGEPFVMTIEARFPLKAGITFLMPDTIAHFEFLEPPVIDSVRESETIRLKGKFKLTSFDSGHWVIPSMVLNGNVKSDSIGIDVIFSEFNPDQPYHDIKDILEPRASAKKQWWWYAVAAALLMAIVIFYFLRKEKPLPARQQEKIDPYNDAMNRLEELQRIATDSKQYHSKLTDIFRLYIFQRKGILSLQKTTDDLILQLKNIGLPKEDFEKLTHALRLNDFVKFAKYNPSGEDSDVCFNTIIKSIQLIEQSDSRSPSFGGS